MLCSPCIYTHWMSYPKITSAHYPFTASNNDQMNMWVCVCLYISRSFHRFLFSITANWQSDNLISSYRQYRKTFSLIPAVNIWDKRIFSSFCLLQITLIEWERMLVNGNETYIAWYQNTMECVCVSV